MISVRSRAGRPRGSRGSTPSSRLRSRASRIARNLRLIESLWRYGIGGHLARFGCNLTRSVYIALGAKNERPLRMKNMLTSPLGRAVLVLSLSYAAPIVMAQADKPTEQEPPEFKGWCKYRWQTNKPIPPRLNLPSWACEIAEDRKLHLRYDINTKINPFYLTGDFDADGKLDVAVRVQEKKSKKIGLVIMHGDKRLFVLWAGTPFEGRKDDDDLSYSDQWS